MFETLREGLLKDAKATFADNGIIKCIEIAAISALHFYAIIPLLNAFFEFDKGYPPKPTARLVWGIVFAFIGIVMADNMRTSDKKPDNLLEMKLGDYLVSRLSGIVAGPFVVVAFFFILISDHYKIALALLAAWAAYSWNK